MKTADELCADFHEGIKALDDAGDQNWPDALANIMFSALMIMKGRNITFGGMSIAAFLEELDAATEPGSPEYQNVFAQAKIARN